MDIVEEIIFKNQSHIEFIPEVEFDDSFLKYLLNKRYHKRAVRVLRFLVSSISRLMNNPTDDKDDHERGKYLFGALKLYLKMMPTNRKKREHLQIFDYYGIPDHIVSLYKSPVRNNKDIAEEAIRLFIYPNIGSFPIYMQHLFCNVVWKFCYLLRKDLTTREASRYLLYYSCRQSYGHILKSLGTSSMAKFFYGAPPLTLLRDLVPCTRELTQQLLLYMEVIRESCFCKAPDVLKARFGSDIREFSVFALHTCAKIDDCMRSCNLSLHTLSLPAMDVVYKSLKPLKLFYDDFNDLLNNIDLCLTDMDDGAEYTRCMECEYNHGWSYFLPILKELDMISKICRPAKQNFSSCLNSHKVSINKLIMKSKRGDDHQWILRHKDLVYDESRRHLIEMMFPAEMKNGCELQKMKVLVDKSQLLVDSFQQVGLANPILLRNGIIPQFKNEVAFEAGPGVFKEWLRLVCQHLFDPCNSLFLSSPRDHQRLYPNPAKVDSQQLQYYGFCGRVIALALMHSVQIGIGFDRLFFLQVAGTKITLEDIRDADPCVYKSCKDILQMDTEFIDSDNLGLTFVWETEEVDESGSERKTVELCPGGNTMVVNSMNRKEYIELVIQHCFKKSIEDKVKLFIQGLDDVLTRRRRKIFFQSVELLDLDQILLERRI